MLRLTLYLAVLLALPAALLGLNWLFATRRTDLALLEAGPVRRLGRWYRALWLRTGAELGGWPHVVDRALGTHRAHLPASTWETVWTHDRCTLSRIEESPGGGPAVLLVHSLISKPWILDLTEQRSLARAVRDAGFDTYLLDWGDFTRADATNDLSHYANVLMQAEKQVLATNARSHVHLVGYCLGGTLCLARVAARRHDDIASLSLVATPWDFDVPSTMHTVLSHPLLKPVFFLDGSSGVPGSLVRESFHILRPQALRTVGTLIARRRDASFRQSYDPLARWIWEHRRLPGALLFDLVRLFRTNDLLEGRMEIAGDIARLSDVRAPVSLFIAERDHIVPSGSAHAAAVDELEVEVHAIPSGHVSMICGSAAREVMWPRLIASIRTAEERVRA